MTHGHISSILLILHSECLFVVIVLNNINTGASRNVHFDSAPAQCWDISQLFVPHTSCVLRNCHVGSPPFLSLSLPIHCPALSLCLLPLLKNDFNNLYLIRFNLYPANAIATYILPITIVKCARLLL